MVFTEFKEMEGGASGFKEEKNKTLMGGIPTKNGGVDVNKERRA